MQYSKLKNLPTVPDRFSTFSDVKRAHGDIERILHQLKAQGQIVNNQK